MRGIKAWATTYYMYLIPSVSSVGLMGYCVYKIIKKMPINFILGTTYLADYCSAIINFTSIILGVYGVFIPIILGKMDDKFIKFFWQNIDRVQFSRDIQHVILSGIITIIISIIFLVFYNSQVIILNILAITMIWFLLFFACSSYRFLCIFIKLVVGKNEKKISLQIKSQD